MTPKRRKLKRLYRLRRRLVRHHERQFNIGVLAELHRLHECILRIEHFPSWLRVQRLVADQLHPMHRTGYARMHTWNQ